MNNATMNTDVQTSLWDPGLFFFFEYKPRTGTARSYVILCLIFWENTIVFSTAAVPFYIPTNSAWGFQFLHSVTNTCDFLCVCVCVCVFLVIGILMSVR